MPAKAHATDAAFDVFTREDVELVPYLRTAIPLGFKIQLPPHFAAVIQPRSGMSLKGMACKVRTENGSIDARIDADVLVGLVAVKSALFYVSVAVQRLSCVVEVIMVFLFLLARR